MRASELAARNLKVLRRQAGDMTGEEFGKRMGELGYPMSRQTVWKIEQGQRAMTLDEVMAAAYVLGTSPLGLLSPGADAIDVGEGVSLDADKLGEWWVHGYHPRTDVTEEQINRSLPEPLRPHYENIQFLDDDRRQLAYTVERITEGLRGLPEEELRKMGQAMQKEQDDA